MGSIASRSQCHRYCCCCCCLCLYTSKQKTTTTQHTSLKERSSYSSDDHDRCELELELELKLESVKPDSNSNSDSNPTAGFYEPPPRYFQNLETTVVSTTPTSNPTPISTPTPTPRVHGSDTLRQKFGLISRILSTGTRNTDSPKQPSTPTQTARISTKDFIPLGKIGRGSYGIVYLVQHRGNQRLYAMKEMKRIKDMQTQFLHEKTVMQKNQHPFLMELACSFQQDGYLYLVMEYMPGGELYDLMRVADNRLPENAIRFYIAEVVLALEYLHVNQQVIYRDLKPENILIAQDGHLKLADFGLAYNSKKAHVTHSFCGTAEYMAPEIFTGNGYTKAVDLWALGCLTYEMIVGHAPFSLRRHEKTLDEQTNLNLLFDRISKAPVPVHFRLSAAAYSLVFRLLAKDPRKRLGSNGFKELKNHRFFNGVDWKKMLEKQIKPPFVPPLLSPSEVQQRFTKTVQFRGAVRDPNPNANANPDQEREREREHDPDRIPDFSFTRPFSDDSGEDEKEEEEEQELNNEVGDTKVKTKATCERMNSPSSTL